MSKNAGDIVEAGDDTYNFTGDGSTSVGDALSYGSGGDVTVGDAGTASHNLLGVRPEGQPSGDVIPGTVQGAVVAKVASGLAKNTLLTLGSSANSNAGLLVSGGSGASAPISLSAEGGTYKGASVPAGHAVVLLR